MARAFGVGIETSPCCDEAVPMGVVELGTASSQPSSCLESCWRLSVYQEPACEGLRVTMLVEGWSIGGGVCEWRHDGMGSAWGSYDRLVGWELRVSCASDAQQCI